MELGNLELSPARRRLLGRYGAAIGLSGLALILRGVLPFPEGIGIYHLPLAAVVCIVGTQYWFLPPVNSFAVAPEHRLPFAIFVALCFLLSEFSAGRRRAERAVRESDDRFRALVQFSFDVYWETDARHRFTRQEFGDDLADAPARGSEIGKTRWEIPFVEPDEEAWRRHRARLDAHLPFRDFEIARPTPDGGRRYVSVSGIPVFDESGRFAGYRGVGRHITERKVAEAERRAHMWLLESMDRVHRSMQGTDHFQEMVNNVLGEVLDIFQCERVVLSVFGIRCGTAWYKRLAIKLRAGHDHRDRVGIEYVADEDAHAMRMEVRAAARPVALVLGSVPPHIARVHAHFRTQSTLSMSIEAKQERREYDHFYYFSIEQCSCARVWTADEMRLFEEIGRRLGDALTKLSTLAELQRRDAYLSAAQRLSRTASWAWDPARNAFVHWSRGWLPLRGPESAPDLPTLDTVRQSIYPQDRAAWSERFEKALRERSELDVEYRCVQPDGTVRRIRTAGHPVLDGLGELVEFVGTDIDTTEHHAHLWFLESMDRINRAMQGTSDLERMMSEVLDAVLEIFDSDRAWLLYPCDPNAPSWRAVMEHARPQFPGAAARGRDLPMSADSAEVARAALDAGGALAAGPGHERAVKPDIAAHFGVRSEMLMALRPKGDRPYLFGLHQCSRARTWTQQEQRLFEDIAHRLGDALSHLVAFRRLRESEARLEAAQGLAHVGWWERDYASGRVSLSDEARRIFGVEPVDLSDWHGRWLSLIHPEDRQKAVEASEREMRGEGRYDVEYRVVRPDGAVRLVRSQGDVTRDDSGRPVRQFGVMQDITDLWHAQQALRSRQEMLDLAQKAARAVAFDWFIGPRESENRWSPELEAMYGLKAGRFDRTYQGWKKLVHADDWPSVKLAIERANRSGDVDAEYRVVHEGGEIRWLHAKGRMFFGADGRPERMIGFMIDVSGRRFAEEQLKASEQRFRTFVDRATDAFFLLDEMLNVVDVNRQACESLGHTREELIGMHPRMFDALLEEAAIGELAKRARRGEIITFETLHRRKDGSTFPVEVRTGTFQQGGKLFYLALARDISERKLAEETLRGKDNALAMARTELARVSRLTTLGELTTSIVHEVSQPLGAMITSAAAGARWLAAAPPDIMEARAALDNIAADGKRARVTIERIRALAKRQAPRAEKLDLNEKILGVLALTEHELRSHDIVLRTQLKSNLPRVTGDRVQLQQVLLNLIVNAIEAMSGVRDRTRELRIVSRPEGPNAVMVEVRDSGTGIGAQSAERVFESFYTTKPEGLGIGLSISRSIVEAHGGRLSASANSPHGAVFRFSLPVAAAEPS